MERAVKFRGKVVNHDPMTNPENGWVEGYYLQDLDNGEVKHYIFNCPMKWEVDADTVGQFTGVLDKNGKEIYEGDVLSVREWKNLAFGMFNHDEMKALSLDDCKGELLKDIKSLVYWDEGSMLATEQNGCAYYMCSFWHEDTLITQPIFDIEIIGNIHDTPNLLTDGRD